jgi:hypothetical protein
MSFRVRRGGPAVCRELKTRRLSWVESPPSSSSTVASPLRRGNAVSSSLVSSSVTGCAVTIRPAVPGDWKELVVALNQQRQPQSRYDTARQLVTGFGFTLSVPSLIPQQEKPHGSGGGFNSFTSHSVRVRVLGSWGGTSAGVSTVGVGAMVAQTGREDEEKKFAQ